MLSKKEKKQLESQKKQGREKPKGRSRNFPLTCVCPNFGNWKYAIETEKSAVLTQLVNALLGSKMIDGREKRRRQLVEFACL